MSTVNSFGVTAPYFVVACLNSIILRQQLEAQTLRHEIGELRQRVRDDQGVRQFARYQLEQYEEFLRGPMQEEEVKCEVERLGELEDDACDDDDDGAQHATPATVITASTTSERIVCDRSANRL